MAVGDAWSGRSFGEVVVDFGGFWMFLGPVGVPARPWRGFADRVVGGRAVSSGLWDVAFGPPCTIHIAANYEF